MEHYKEVKDCKTCKYFREDFVAVWCTCRGQQHVFHKTDKRATKYVCGKWESKMEHNVARRSW